MLSHSPQKISYRKKLSLNTLTYFSLGCLIGAIIFIITYGVNILNVTYDSWLLDENANFDLTIEYLGWLFFRRSAWSFPLGHIDNLMYPQGVSIYYTDSIPLVAIILKIFSNFLPETFQYLGIYAGISYMLQGGFSAIIIKKMMPGSVSSMLYKVIPLVTTILFIFSSVHLLKTAIQPALASNYLILAAFSVWVYRDDFFSYKRKLAIWTILGIASVSIHLYYAPMVFGIMFCSLLHDTLENKKVFKNYSILVFSVVSALITLWLFGAFNASGSLSTNGLGKNCANFNTLFNSFGRGILPPLADATGQQFSSFSYLGVGGILLFITAIITALVYRQKATQDFISLNSAIIPIALCFLGFFIFALSPTITFGKYTLGTIPLPQFVINVWSIFRATGRFLWPIMYGCYIISIAVIAKYLSPKYSLAAISICILIQIFEFSPIASRLHTDYAPKKDFTSSFDDDVWHNLADGKEKLFLLTSHNRYNKVPAVQFLGKKETIYLGLFAYENNLSINDMYIARRDSERISNYRSEIWENIYSGHIDDSAIYLFFESPPIGVIQKKLMYVYIIDNYYVGLKQPIALSDRRIRLINEISDLSILPKLGEYTTNCKYTKNGLLMDSGGEFYGMLLPLNPGKYTVTIIGENIEHADIGCIAVETNNNIPINIIEHSKELITYEFYTDIPIEQSQFKIGNPTDDAILITDIRLTEM